MVQLVITATIISLFVFVDSVKGYVRENGEQMADIHQLGSGLCLHHRPLLLHQHPKKDSIQLHLLFLGVFTVCGQQAEAEEIAKKTQHQGFSQ